MRVYEDEMDDATMMEEMHGVGEGGEGRGGEEMYLEDESGKALKKSIIMSLGSHTQSLSI